MKTCASLMTLALVLVACAPDEPEPRPCELETTPPCVLPPDGEPPKPAMDYDVLTVSEFGELYDIWVDPDGGDGRPRAFAVGAEGTIIRYNGAEWELEQTGFAYNLFAVWGSSLDDIWFAGSEGTLLHFDGESIEPYCADPVAGCLPEPEWLIRPPTWWRGIESLTFYDLWGLSADDMWLVGGDGSYVAGVFRYNGTTWEWQDDFADLELNPLSIRDLNTVYGFASDNVYLGGGWSTLFHWNGTTVNQHFYCDEAVPTITQESYSDTITDLWGPSPDTVYAVGGRGSLFQLGGACDGGAGDRWTRIQVCCPIGCPVVCDGGEEAEEVLVPLWGIHGVDSNLFWLTGQNGTIFRYEDGNWALESPRTKEFIRGITTWGSQASPTGLMVGGNGLVVQGVRNF